MSDESPNTLLGRWRELYSIPRAERVGGAIALAVLFLGSLALGIVDLGARFTVGIWLGIALYVTILILLIRAVPHRARRAVWPFWPYFLAGASGALLVSIIQESTVRQAIAWALTGGLIWGGAHWALVRSTHKDASSAAA